MQRPPPPSERETIRGPTKAKTHAVSAPGAHTCTALACAALAWVALTVAIGIVLAAEPIRLSWTPDATHATGTPAGWQALTFKSIARHTRYTVVALGTGYVIKAEANASASGLMHPVSAEARTYPILRWRWKVENVLMKGDVAKQEGDDYPARVYVAFAYDPRRASFAQRLKYEAARLLHGAYPPHAGLNYIWDTRAPIDTTVPNPFTDRVRMIVVESGAGRVGDWLEYQRDIYADYRKAFDEEPPAISGIAIMTDADNTGESATAYYGEISLSPR